MPRMSSTQRQRRYRAARHDPDGPAERQINIVLTDQAITALARIAIHTKRTRRAVLAELILAAQDDILDTLNSAEANQYFDANTQTSVTT